MSLFLCEPCLAVPPIQRHIISFKRLVGLWESFIPSQNTVYYVESMQAATNQSLVYVSVPS